MNYNLKVELPLQMKSELDFLNAVDEGESVGFFGKFGWVFGILFAVFSSVSSKLIFCSIELFQLLVLLNILKS